VTINNIGALSHSQLFGLVCQSR